MHNALQHIREIGGIVPPLLTRALDGGKWSASHSHLGMLNGGMTDQFSEQRTGEHVQKERHCLIQGTILA
jgi:hypothetical protein